PFASGNRAPPVLPSFPTRRSSDLGGPPLHLGRGQLFLGDGARFRTHVLTRPSSPARKRSRTSLNENSRRASARALAPIERACGRDRKSTRLNSSHGSISSAVFCLK